MSRITQDNFSLYSPQGDRKYINRHERRRVLKLMEERLSRERALFAQLLVWTGGRVSEILSVRPSSFQIDRCLVALRTLKRRRPHVREIPISPLLMAAIDLQYGLTALQLNPDTANARLWPWSRVTAWRFVKGVMMEAGIVGRAASPRGLRHAFGVGTLQANVPLNLVQRWMGHARLTTTAIYANVMGDDELAFATKFWKDDV